MRQLASRTDAAVRERIERTKGADTAQHINTKGNFMAAKFEIYKDKAGEFRFRLKATNGQTILASEGYKARAGCMNGVESVRKNAPDDARYERKATESGKYRFNLKSGNNQVIGTSESYETEKARDGGIESVKKNAPVAVIADMTEPTGKSVPGTPPAEAAV